MPDEIDSDLDDNKESLLLFADLWINLSRGKHNAVIESQVWSNLSFRLFSIALLFVWAFFCVCWWMASIESDQIAYFVVAVIFSACGIFGILNFAQSLYPRRFVIDFDNQSCLFSNVPGFGLAVPFAEIESITVVSCRRFSSVGLTLCGHSRSLRIHLFTGNPTKDGDSKQRAVKFADVFSQLLGCEINVIENASVFTNWRMMSWR